MKKKKNQKSLKPQSNESGRPTLLEFLAGFYSEAKKQFGIKLEIDPALPVSPLPEWAKKTVKQLGKTVFKPVLKLRSSKKSTCQDYGKLIGVLDRGITFYRKDAWKIIEDEGLDIRLIAGIDASGDRRCGGDTRKNGLMTKAVGNNQVVPAVSKLCDETASTDAGMVT
jgi:hypothetical protein